jgi:rare lipoprotein A
MTVWLPLAGVICALPVWGEVPAPTATPASAPADASSAPAAPASSEASASSVQPAPAQPTAVVASAAPVEPVEPEPQVGPPFQKGIASWYGPRFHGRLTANGERFDRNAMTAAHRSLPFGTRVRVRVVSNGAEITVRINDRGPYIPGRIIDLSEGAARKVGIAGVAVVELRLLQK